jgi:hypothetical protein
MLIPSLIFQADYWRKRVRKLSARALSAIKKAGPKAQALLDTVGPTIEARQKAFEEMAEASELRAYRLEPKEWTYMDVAGDRKSGTTEELEGSLSDPLGKHSHYRKCHCDFTGKKHRARNNGKVLGGKHMKDWKCLLADRDDRLDRLVSHRTWKVKLI